MRSLSVNSYSQVSGADFNVRLRYKNEMSFDSARLAYVGGTRAVMGNAGLGYSFSNTSVFATGAAQAAYSRLGADYLFNQGSIKPYAEANSLYMPKSVAPNQGGNSCNSPYTLTSTSSVSPFTGVNPSVVKNGQTCINPPIPSDRRLKRSIHLLATLDSGIKIYSFKYLWSDIVYVGVMAQDLLKNSQWKKAVVRGQNNFYAVDYQALGLKMTTLEDWNEAGLSSILFEPAIN